MTSRRPYVVLSVATSIDGLINDTTPGQLAFSNEEDFDRVDQLRAGCDAILVGANTLRGDDPRLNVRDAGRQAARVAAGQPAQPARVVITRSGDLDRSLRWFDSPGRRIIYTVERAAAGLEATVGDRAEVVSLGPDIDLGALLSDLGAKGVGRLMVEGGGQVHTAFASQGLVDEIHLAIAPTLVGHGARFLGPTTYPWPPDRRFTLVETRAIGDMVFARYRLTGG